MASGVWEIDPSCTCSILLARVSRFLSLSEFLFNVLSTCSLCPYSLSTGRIQSLRVPRWSISINALQRSEFADGKRIRSGWCVWARKGLLASTSLSSDMFMSDLECACACCSINPANNKFLGVQSLVIVITRSVNCGHHGGMSIC